MDWQWRMNADAASRNCTSVLPPKIVGWRTLPESEESRRPEFRTDGGQAARLLLRDSRKGLRKPPHAPRVI